MGCLADLANPYAFKGEGRGLPIRKTSLKFELPQNYEITDLKDIKGFDYVYVLMVNNKDGDTTERLFVILDTNTMSAKYETNILMINTITFPKKDEMKIQFPSYIKPGYDITLKLTADKVTEISKEPNSETYQSWNEKRNEVFKIGKKVIDFENGNALYVFNPELKTATDKTIVLKDKNDNEIKKITVPGRNLDYCYINTNQKYIALEVLTISTRDKIVEIYSLPDLNKVSTFQVPRMGGNPVSFPKVYFINNGKIILALNGQINFADIKTGKIEKTFSPGKELQPECLYSLENDTFVLCYNNGVVCKFKSDGTIISKTRSELWAPKTSSVLSNSKRIISYVGETRNWNLINCESLDETQ